MAQLRRFPGFVRAVRTERTLSAAERMNRAELEAHQRLALGRTVAHARVKSRFYRELYSAHGVDEHSPLSALPPVGKAELMARFDDWVTDPRVTLAGVRAHLQDGASELLAGEFATMASGGSSRQPGAYVFDRREWTMVMAAAVRGSRWSGSTPRLPRRRLAFVHAPGYGHMAGRIGVGFDVGLHRTMRAPSTLPRRELVATLNAFRPDSLIGYASMVALLAAEQLDGSLKITPSAVMTTSEPVTSEMTDRIRAAWGVEHFNMYATTETGSLGMDCHRHEGLHVFEDLTIVEVVDADDRPVADGDPGDHLLVTNLFSETQPFIRYRLNDMTSFEPQPCGCGSPFRRLRRIDGRTDDVLQFPDRSGQPVDLHSTAFSSLFSLDGVCELEIVQRGQALCVAAVPRANTDPDAVRRRLADGVTELLAARGCEGVECRVDLTDALQRHPVAGKIKLVRREPERDPVLRSA
jgi:phenylacetate-CoA ligase